MDVLDSEFITRGPVTRELETRLSAVCDKEYCVTCSNGTIALWMALEASRELAVYSPTLTYSAVVNAMSYTTSWPTLELYDSDVDTLCVDWSKHSGLDGAIVAMDYAGYPSLQSYPRRFTGTVILDAAHSLGARLDDGSSNTKYADIVTLSLHALKLVTGGEGGAVLTNSDHIHSELLKLRNNGIDETGQRVTSGLNCNMDEMSAALALSQLKRLPDSIKRRHEIANYYYHAWEHDVRVILPAWAKGHAFHLFPIRLSEYVKCDIPTFRKELLELGVGTQVHYRPIHLMPAEAHHKLAGIYPIAEKAYERLISIPMYYGLNDRDVGTVISAINQTMEKYS
jgi:dTDP-4-amino-4,6-dideoxygalactose transaminase